VAATAFPRRGGPPAVDLVNTTIVERGRPRELLASDEELAAWLALERERLGLDEVPTKASLRDFHALRDALRQTFAAVASARRPPAASLDAINRASRRQPIAPQLDWPTRGAARVSTTIVRSRAPDPLAAVARSAITLLGGPGRTRLRACANPSCVLFFVGGNGRRLYCSASCGNRVRVARHAARR
jgi:predicted RNA-binding Zn ribbon-like protein